MQEMFGVSRAVVLEAVRVLEQMGLVHVRRGAKGGVFVNAVDAGSLVEAMWMLFASDGVPLQEVNEYRLHIEGMNAYWAALRASGDDLEALQAVAAESERLAREQASPLDVQRCDVVFHATVARASKNRVSLYVMQGLLGVINQILSRTPPSVAPSSPRHIRSVVEAIVARDPARAKAAMEEHIRFFAQTLDEPAEWPHPDGAAVER